MNCKELCAADPSYTKSQKEFSKEEMSGEGDAIYKNEQNLMLRKFETLWLPEQEEEDQEIKLAIEASLKEAQLQKDKENQQK